MHDLGILLIWFNKIRLFAAERRRNASGYCNKKDSNISNDIKSLSSGEQPNDTKVRIVQPKSLYKIRTKLFI